MAGLFLKLMDEAVREALREGGQGFRADHTGDFPVADGGILAHALLLQAGKGTGGCIDPFAGSHAVDVEQAQIAQVGAVEIRVLCDGTQSVGALVAKRRGVRLCADAETVEDDQKNTLFHIGLLHFLRDIAPDKVLLLILYYKQNPHRMQGFFRTGKSPSFSPKSLSFRSQIG